MKLLFKFNLLLIILVAIALGIVASIAHSFLIDNAKAQVVQQAKLMMESATATRKYTDDNLKPLLLQAADDLHTFLPETVPAHGATVIFSKLRQNFPDYTYREATLNPTNPQDRAVDWETDVIEHFRNNPSDKELVGERMTPTGMSLYLAHPIVAAQGCMQCHSSPSIAPQTMINKYGTDNGFGWGLNQVVAAQIVSVPMDLPFSIANRAFRTLMLTLIIAFVGIIIAVNLVLYTLIIQPVRKLSAVADSVSLGHLDSGELPVRGKDEIAQLTASFNRLFVSVVKAMKMLDS